MPTSRSTAPPIPSVQTNLLEVLRVQGTGVIVGSYKKPAEVDLLKIEFKELTLIGIRVYETKDYDIAIAMMETGRIDFDLFLDEFTADQAPGVFEDLVKGSSAIKVLFKM